MEILNFFKKLQHYREEVKVIFVSVDCRFFSFLNGTGETLGSRFLFSFLMINKNGKISSYEITQWIINLVCILNDLGKYRGVSMCLQTN